ncbi:TPA: hypothetical protein ACG4LH_002330, partial [Klebsiella pneumoniae]
MAEVPLPTPTQVPVPSTDIRNAVFAGAKLDEEVTGTGEFYTDRLGVKRLTNTGRNNQFDAAQLDRANRFEQFLLSSGYVFLGDYEDGPFQFSARNQYIRYDNQYYRLNAATDVGFTTTGTDATSFANDVTHFVLMDGDTLRQNLGSDEGADLVSGKKPYTGTVRRKIAEMLSETISPWDFNCKPDAVFDPVTQRLIDGTDNTAELQRMFSEAHYHGVDIILPFSGKFASKSLYLHYDPIKNPDWIGRPGRLTIRGSVLGHATGDVERQGSAIFHIPGENAPLISMIGEFSISDPAAMGGYFELSSLNLIGSQDSSDVLLLQGSQGQMKLERYDVKVLNPAGNGITEATTWETLHLLGFIRGPATGDGSCTGIGLNIKSDDTIGQINMKQYLNVNVMKMGYGIRAGRREKANGTLGPLVFTGGQTSGADHYGMWLDGGVISFSCTGMQHEGSRKNGLRIDNILEDGGESTDLA